MCLIWNMWEEITLYGLDWRPRDASEKLRGTHRWGNWLPLSRQGAGCVLGAHGQGGHLLLSSSAGPMNGASGFGWGSFHVGSSSQRSCGLKATHWWRTGERMTGLLGGLFKKQRPGCVCGVKVRDGPRSSCRPWSNQMPQLLSVFLHLSWRNVRGRFVRTATRVVRGTFIFILTLAACQKKNNNRTCMTTM